jgi:3-oxoacyl-[acyl-carrier protein] reductase
MRESQRAAHDRPQRIELDDRAIRERMNAMTGFLDDWAGLAGKVAIVTGGAGGLGLPITQDLVRAGVRVAVCDRDADAITALADLEDGRPEYTETFDVRNSEQLQSFFANVIEKFGQLDILVDVPGGSFRADATDLSGRAVDAIIRQNFTYAFESSQIAARQMKAQGTGGSIVHISSIEAHRAMPQMVVYGAMKAAVAHMSQTLACEWGPDGIRVNSVAPDLFPTPATLSAGWTDGQENPERDALNDAICIPLGRKGSSRDLTGVVLFLASDLSAYVTGTTVHVDGGTLAMHGWLKWPDAYRNTLPADVVGFVQEQATAKA